MKKEFLAFLPLFVIFLFPAIGYSQTPVVTITQGQFTRHDMYFGDVYGMSGEFAFTNDNSNVTGILYPQSPGSTWTFCPRDIGCVVGQQLKIFDRINGIATLKQGSMPVVVNGVTYQTVRYDNALLVFDAGTIRIPRYPAKRSTFKLTYPATLTGYIPIRDSSNNIIFDAELNLSGTVTINFQRYFGYSDPSVPRYGIREITYNFPKAGGN